MSFEWLGALILIAMVGFGAACGLFVVLCTIAMVSTFVDQARHPEKRGIEVRVVGKDEK